MTDSIPETPPPRRGRPKSIATLSDVKQAMARCLRALERSAKDPAKPGAMPVDHARALIYGYSKIAELMKDLTADALAERLSELEQRQARIEESASH